MRIVVFSRLYDRFSWLSVFPHVRGHVLAKYLRQLGEDAEFRALPIDGDFDVAICSDYQGDAEWHAAQLQRMVGLRARRWFCMVDYGTTGHPSAPMVEWFADRGGALVQMREVPLAPHESYIGIGVDEVVRFDAERERRTILFDFHKSKRRDSSLDFDVRRLGDVRRAFPSHRVVGSGPVDSSIRGAFDGWIPYGQPHDQYVRCLDDCVAFVPGTPESMGLTVAEAQVAGAAIVCPDGWVKPEILTPAAWVGRDDLIGALRRATRCDPARINAEATARFSPLEMARRTLDAIKL